MNNAGRRPLRNLRTLEGMWQNGFPDCTAHSKAKHSIEAYAGYHSNQEPYGPRRFHEIPSRMLESLRNNQPEVPLSAARPYRHPEADTAFRASIGIL